MSCMRAAWCVGWMLALVAQAFAQTTQPNRGSFDNQPIRRTESSVGTQTAATTAQAKFDSAAGESVLRGLEPARVMLALGIVIGLIFALRWMAKKLFPAAAAGKSAGVVRVLARTPLNPRQQIVLIQVGRRIVVVGDCGAQMNALAQIKDDDEVASILGMLSGEQAPLAGVRFGNLFGKAQERFEEPEADDIDAAPSDLGLSQARGELSGLIEKVRGLARSAKKS